MPRPNLMQSEDSFKDAVEALLEEWDGKGAEEDVLEQAMGMAADAEHGKRLLYHRKRMRGEKDEPPAPMGGEEEARPVDGVCPDCGKPECECLPDDHDYDE